jgi:outer membrane protein OmpA-like peptidoglycan-associated protein
MIFSRQLIISVGLFATLSASSFATDYGNWRSTDGHQWRNGDGTLCWRSSNWTPANASQGCDGAIQPANKPAVVEPKQSLVVIGVNQSARGVELVLPNQVLFEVGKASLNTTASAPYLDRMAELILTKSKQQVLVEGHTDAQGSGANNQALSELRAEVIYDALRQRGIPMTRMTAQGVAATKPVAPNNLEAGRRLNRRTEIVILEETVANLMRGEPTNSFEQVADIIRRELDKGAKP